MKDKLQRFVRDNREAFDVHEPSDALWEKLSQKLPKDAEGTTHEKITSTVKVDSSLNHTSATAAIVHESFQNGRIYNPFFLRKPEGGGGIFEYPADASKAEKGNQPKSSNRWNWRIAASIALLIGLGWAGYTVFQNYGVTSSSEFALTNPVYAKQVGQYTQLIDSKRLELGQMTQTNPALYQEFEGELEQLEHSYQNLKIDLPKNPNQEIVIQAMIQNLQWQIDLLNKQLDVIQRIKNKNNHANDKIA